MFMLEYNHIGWWCWLVSASLLLAGIAGNKAGFLIAVGLTIFWAVHFILLNKGDTAFPVQTLLFFEAGYGQLE